MHISDNSYYYTTIVHAPDNARWLIPYINMNNTISSGTSYGTIYIGKYGALYTDPGLYYLENGQYTMGYGASSGGMY